MILNPWPKQQLHIEIIAPCKPCKTHNIDFCLSIQSLSIKVKQPFTLFLVYKYGCPTIFFLNIWKKKRSHVDLLNFITPLLCIKLYILYHFYFIINYFVEMNYFLRTTNHEFMLYSIKLSPSPQLVDIVRFDLLLLPPVSLFQNASAREDFNTLVKNDSLSSSIEMRSHIKSTIHFYIPS